MCPPHLPPLGPEALLACAVALASASASQRSHLHPVLLNDGDPHATFLSCPFEPSGCTYGLSHDMHCSLWLAVGTPALPSAPGQQRAPGPQTKSQPLSAPPRRLSASHPGSGAQAGPLVSGRHPPAGPGVRPSRGLALSPVQTGQGTRAPHGEHSWTLDVTPRREALAGPHPLVWLADVPRPLETRLRAQPVAPAAVRSFPLWMVGWCLLLWAGSRLLVGTWGCGRLPEAPSPTPAGCRGALCGG